MIRTRNLSVLLLLAALMLAGCAPRYVVVDKLQTPLSTTSACSIGAIIDGLPPEIDVSDRPTAEDIQMFASRIQEALTKEELFEVTASKSDSGGYEVSGTILEYKKGNGFLRFMFGAWAGGSKVTTNLKLTEKRTGTLVFSGNFVGAVTDWASKGDKMYTYVAKDFAKALKKENKKLLENK